MQKDMNGGTESDSDSDDTPIRYRDDDEEEEPVVQSRSIISLSNRTCADMFLCRWSSRESTKKGHIVFAKYARRSSDQRRYSEPDPRGAKRKDGASVAEIGTVNRCGYPLRAVQKNCFGLGSSVNDRRRTSWSNGISCEVRPNLPVVVSEFSLPAFFRRECGSDVARFDGRETEASISKGNVPFRRGLDDSLRDSSFS